MCPYRYVEVVSVNVLARESVLRFCVTKKVKITCINSSKPLDFFVKIGMIKSVAIKLMEV